MIDRSLNYGRHHVRRFLERSMPYETVLDIGAGLGTDLFIAREVNPNAELHAIEVYEEYQKALISKKINVHAADLEKSRLPFDDASLDVVISNQILEHVKEIFWIFHEMTRCLRVGGKLIVGVPNLASLHNRLMLLGGLQPSIIKNNSAHVRGHSKHDMLRFLESCFPGGYRLRGFGGGNFYPFPGPIARPLATMLPNMAWSIFLLLEKTREYDGSFLRYPTEQQLETNFYTGPA